jgi:CO dehydrogenase/acetyl-CoA synthase gamma subunit (corrinoid Fe-S protein)
MILTLLWIIISALTAQTDSNYKQTVETLKEQGQSLNFYKQKITLLASRYEKVCAEKGLMYQTDSSNRTELDRLTGKISFLTPNVFRNETAVVQITALFNKCESLIEETESASTIKVAAETQKKMQRFVDNAITEVDMLKNLTRG